MSLSLAVYAAWAAAVAHTVNRIVPEPYMDEIIHISQAQAYCNGHWTTWDARLTTPPGLYLVSALPANLLPRWRALLCSVASLRAVNLVFSLALPFLYARLLRAYRRQANFGQQGNGSLNTSTEAITVALFPVASFFGSLYYTDLGGLVCILVSAQLSLEGRWASSALAGGVSLLFRQTNIAWVASIAAATVIRKLMPCSLYNPLLSHARPVDVPLSLASLVKQSLVNLHLLMPLLAAYSPIFVLAGVFIAWNGSIVLGDKTNHVATIHVVQLWYFVAFTVAMMAPRILLRPTALRRSVASLLSTPRRLLCSAVATAAIIYSIEHYTIAHPFLLADNRHYAFYVWRKILNIHPRARSALAPIYLVSIKLVYDALASSATMALLELCLFVLSTCATLIPSPLIEPRYFIVPFVLLRLRLSTSAPSSCTETEPANKNVHKTVRGTNNHDLVVVAEGAWYLLIQVVTTGIFLWRPFKWDNPRNADETGLMRFMW
ncbi:hypothetical protein ACM66B_007085 [Microbotryomycetes sp. NB124-2]